MNCVENKKVIRGGCEHMTWKTKNCKRTYTCGLIVFWEKTDWSKWHKKEREVLKMPICAEKPK